jgi:hypothetical protein
MTFHPQRHNLLQRRILEIFEQTLTRLHKLSSKLRRWLPRVDRIDAGERGRTVGWREDELG